MEISDRPKLRSRTWLVAACSIGALVLVGATVGVGSPVASVVILLLFAGIAVLILTWALIQTRRERRSYEAQLTAWAADAAAQSERIRIARELHDLVSHGLGLITTRSSAARRFPGVNGETERESALADIEEASRRTTTELRRMLTVLRSPNDPVDLRPIDSLADLPAIAHGFEASGLHAALEVAELGDVSAGVQVAICAVVREGLANAVRHGGPTLARVQVSREGDAIVATIENEGPSQHWIAQEGTGHGLLGLRERVTALQGTLDVGSVENGYRLTARLPEAVGR